MTYKQATPREIVEGIEKDMHGLMYGGKVPTSDIAKLANAIACLAAVVGHDLAQRER